MLISDPYHVDGSDRHCIFMSVYYLSTDLIKVGLYASVFRGSPSARRLSTTKGS